MSHLDAAITAVQFIEAHLQEDIKVADVADAVHFSLFYFCRIFNQTAHHPPYDYLMRRRLSEAARLLADPAQRITDVAFAYQFGSLEAFSRAFRRMFGRLPSQWQKDGPGDLRRLMNPLTPEHLAHRAQIDSVRPRLVEKSAFPVMGLMTLLKNGGETAVSTLWSLLSPTLAVCTAPHPVYAITDFPGAASETLYMAAIDCPDQTPIPPPLVSRLLPAAAYACFTTANTPPARRLTTDYIYQTWLPQSRYELALPLEIAQFDGWELVENPSATATLLVPVLLG